MRSLLLCLCCALASSSYSHAQLLNGDFESPNIAGGYQTFYAGQSIAGWEVYHGDVDLVDMRQYSTSQILDLNGLVPGAIRQTLVTIPGQKYQLTFSWQPNPTSGNALIQRAYLDWNGANYGRLISSGPKVTTESFVFLGTGTDVLSLVSQNQTYAGVMFDNFALVPVDSITQLSAVISNEETIPLAAIPEPSAFAGVFGIALLAFSSSRKIRDRIRRGR